MELSVLDDLIGKRYNANERPCTTNYPSKGRVSTKAKNR